MKKKYLIILNILCIYILPALAQDTTYNEANWNKENQKIVTDFISSVKNQNIEELSNKTSFPFGRKFPIPQIKNQKEFFKRYDEIFDDSLVRMIVNSNPDKDWSPMGWRGIMLFNGILWLGYDGGIIAVNYQSAFERKEMGDLIRIEKSELYKSVKEFKQPICILETSKYRIRIDDLGNWNYRYVSWPLKSKMNCKPDIVLQKGQYIPEGSGGDHSYKFKNGDYVYECSIIVTGPGDSPPALLTIYKGKKVISSQRAKIIEK